MKTMSRKIEAADGLGTLAGGAREQSTRGLSGGVMVLAGVGSRL
jgi:hypothetical protein